MGFSFFSKTPAERFGPDLLDKLPLGISVYRLDDPADSASLRLVYTNPESGVITGLDPDREVGRRIVDISPGVGETGLLERYAEVARGGGAADFGIVTYGDARVRQGRYRVEAVPLPDRQVGVVFEDVTERTELKELLATRAEREREEARYRSLVEATAAVVWTTPPEGEFVEDQPRWREVTGQTAEELLGAGWLDAVHPDDRARTMEAWRRALRERAPYETEHRLRLADGTYRLMAVRAVPVLDEDGGVAEWVGVHTDVEAQRAAAVELAASEARFRTIFDAIPDVVLVYPLGPDGPEPFLTFNDAAVARYGYTADELRSLTIGDLIDAGRLDVGASLAELRKNRQGTFESTHVTKDGRRIPVETSATLAEYDGRLCVIALCRDDTERRQFRRELSRANLDLERAVGERTAEVEAFAEDLKILHRITTAEHGTSEARYEAYLRAGCEMFDLPIGLLSSTPADEAAGARTYRLEAVVAPEGAGLAPGLAVPLREAFCDAVVERGETVAYADAQADVPDHPACAARGLRAFIGTPIWIDDEVVGTLSFASAEPRPNGFAAYERELVEVMAEAIERRLRLDLAEEEQTTAQEWYRSIVETVDEGVIVVDRECRVVMSNPSARDLLGLDADSPHDEDRETDVLRSRWPVVDADGRPIPPEDLPEREVLRTGRAVRGRIQGIAPPDGPVRWYRVNASPVDQDRDGAHDGVVVSFADVGDLLGAAQAARQAEAVLTAVLAASPDGVMAFRSVRDEGGAVADFEWIVANPRAGEIVGHAPEALIGRRLLDVFPGNRATGLFDAYVRVVERGEPVETEVDYAHDGLAARFRVSAAPLPDEDGFTVTFRDVSGLAAAA